MTQEEGFWAWFVVNQAALREIRTGEEPVVSRLRRELDRIDPRLMWEKGVEENGTHEFVVSADGNWDVAPLVHRIADAAPDLTGWRVARFRPVREPSSMSYKGASVEAINIAFALIASPEGGPYNIAVYVPGLTEGNYERLATAAWRIVEGWVGEERSMIRLGEIRFLERPERLSPFAASITDIVPLLRLDD